MGFLCRSKGELVKLKEELTDFGNKSIGDSLNAVFNIFRRNLEDLFGQ